MHIIGHNNILTFFEKATTAEKLHHAYLFVGRAQLGKRTVAEHIARQQFGDVDKTLVTNPDFFIVARGIDAKTGKTKKNISIDQVHELRHFLQGKPFLHTKKIAIIDDAELLSTGAMNALLKTLEEPRGDAMLFLIATDETALLDTIRSRCQTLYFYPVDTSEITAALTRRDIDDHIAADMAEAAAGAPGRVLRWAEDADAYTWYEEEVKRFVSLSGKPFHEKCTLVEELFGKKEDHIKTRAQLIDILNIWLVSIRNTYTGTASAAHAGCDIVAIYNAIDEAKRGLVRNVHPRMLVERILLTLP